MRDFRSLKVWEKAHHLALAVYRASESFPKAERFGLTSQIRRSAFSVPANIAEGCGKSTDAELARYLSISMGSASELEYTCLFVYELGLLNDESYQPLNRQVIEVKRMLTGFIRHLKST